MPQTATAIKARDAKPARGLPAFGSPAGISIHSPPTVLGYRLSEVQQVSALTFIDATFGAYDLELLEQYLSLDHSDEVMLLSQLDGYLTAIAVAPKTIPPSEWFPGIWGGSVPRFSDSKLANAINSSIMGLFNDIVRALADEAAPFEPIFAPDFDGSPLADFWAEGFIRGVALRPIDWKPLFDDEETLVALMPIAVLSSNPDGTYAFDLSEMQRGEIQVAAPSVIPDCIRKMRSFWQEKGLGPSAPPLRIGSSQRSLWLLRRDAESAIQPLKMQATSTKVGRNEPCPCGSGKKYKRCCGA